MYPTFSVSSAASLQEAFSDVHLHEQARILVGHAGLANSMYSFMQLMFVSSSSIPVAG